MYKYQVLSKSKTTSTKTRHLWASESRCGILICNIMHGYVSLKITQFHTVPLLYTTCSINGESLKRKTISFKVDSVTTFALCETLQLIIKHAITQIVTLSLSIINWVVIFLTGIWIVIFLLRLLLGQRYGTCTKLLKLLGCFASGVAHMVSHLFRRCSL